MRDKEQDMSVKDFYQKVDQAKLKEVLSSDDPNELRDVAKTPGSSSPTSSSTTSPGASAMNTTAPTPNNTDLGVGGGRK
jgi:hypothetical protein